MTTTNIINKRSRKKRVNKILKILIGLSFCVSAGGCNPPSILITRTGPFDLTQVRRMVFLPFHGNVTECAREAHHVMETTFSSYFSGKGIQVVPSSLNLNKILGVSGVLNKEKVRQISKDSQADALISGSVSECHYFNSDIGEGSVFLTVKIYDGKTGYLLLVINGKKISETSAESVSHMTIEIVKNIFEMLG